MGTQKHTKSHTGNKNSSKTFSAKRPQSDDDFGPEQCPQRRQEVTKGPPRDPKGAPKGHQDSAKDRQSSQRDPRWTPSGPIDTPSGTKEGPERTQRAPKAAQRATQKTRNLQKNAAKRPQSDDDLRKADSKIDKTAAEWRRYHARSPQPVNKNGLGAWPPCGHQLADV